MTPKQQTATEQGDPRTAAPMPPYHARSSTPPGHERDLSPRADHGEESYRGAGRLTDMVALVTGGDSGIGRAVALAFAREGADVAISYLPEEEEDAAATERHVTDAGRRALRLPGDIRQEQHCRLLVERTVTELGRIDVLVNNAAFQMSHESLDELTADELDRTFRTNVFAMVHLCRAALPRMGPGGSIINTSSIQAFDPSPNLIAYAATKGAIVNFTKSLAKLAAGRGVRVNSVAPGPVWTPLIPSTMPEEKVRTFGQDTPLGRAAQPAELAPLFVFLASAESSYVTGEVLGATGGQMPY